VPADSPPLHLQLHDELYNEALRILRPYMPGEDGITPRQPVVLAEIDKGRRLLARALDVVPDNWSALWVLGRACRVAGYRGEAYDAFRRAFAAKPDHPDVGRELVLQCCINGRAEEAVQVSRRVLALRPDDAALLTNHALAQLLAGDVGGARFSAAKALVAAPDNSWAHAIAQLIEDVIAGRVPRPTRWPGAGPAA